MNKQEYISRLAQGINKYDIPNKYDILADYEQIVDEILIDNEEDFNYVIEKLGYPEILAMEIAQELGYSTKEAKKEESQKAKNVEHRYDVKRQKSNVIWNIIMFFFYLLQTAFSIALVVMIGLVIYFGFDSTISTQSEIKESTVETTIKVCRKNNCDSYISTVPNKGYYYDDDNYSFKRCHNGKCLNFVEGEHSFSFPLGLVLSLSAGVLTVLLWLNYIIVFKNVKTVINRNNEYNRRRNYE